LHEKLQKFARALSRNIKIRGDDQHMEEYKKFAFNIGWSFLSLVVTLLVGFILRVVLARWLGAADLGLYQMTFTIYGFAILIGTLGIPSALIKFVAEYKENEERLHQVTSCGLVNSLFLGVIFSIALFFLAPSLATVFSMPELENLLKILSIIFPFASLYQAQVGVLNGLRRMKQFATLMGGQSILMCIFTVAFVILGFGVEGAISGLVLSIIVACLLGFFLLKGYIGFNIRNHVQNTKKILPFGVQVLGVNSLSTIETQTDIILIGYFLTAMDVGYYSVAVAIAGLFLSIPMAVQRITYPATSEYWAKNNHSALNKMIDKSMKYCACILLPLALVFWFFGKEIVLLIFGQDFIYAVLPLQILLIGRVIRGSTFVSIGGSLTGVGRPDLSLKIRAISVATNVGLNVLLIPIFGIAGAAIATAASAILGTMLFLALIIKTLTVKIDFRWYIRAMGTAFIAFIAFWGAASLTNPYFAGGAILLIYVAIVFKFLLTAEDKAMFWSLLRHPIH